MKDDERTMKGDSGEDRELDSLIDEAARRLTAGEPSPSFAAGVLARLHDRETPGRVSRAWRSPWVLSPLAAAACIVMWVFVTRPVPDRDRRAEPPAPQAPSVAAGRTEPSRPGLQAGPSVAVDRRLPVRQVSRRPAEGNAAYWRRAEIDALAPPLLVVDSIGLTAIPTVAIPAADSIAVPPLDPLAPIIVTPIEEPQ